MIKFELRRKALFAVLAGMAFFLTCCQVMVPVKKDILKDTRAERFGLAEEYWKRGELERALNEYDAYLQRYPGDEKSALALDRMAEINYIKGQYKKSLELYEQISATYPDYHKSAYVHYQIARLLNRLNDYRHSADEALEWLQKYPQDPLTGDVQMLLGEDLKALGKNAEAFRWWLKAKDFWSGDLERELACEKKLEELIDLGDLKTLERMSEYASGSDYAPRIHHRMAVLFLEQSDLEKAKAAAMALIRSTREQSWVTLGRQILEKVEEELAVKPGVIGCLLPLTGPFAIYGEEVLNGIQLGTGIFGDEAEVGVDLELVIRDTEGTPDLTLAGLEDLVHDEKVMAVIGPLSSRTSVAVAEKADSLGVPIITLTQKKEITEAGDMVFRNFLTPSREIQRLLDLDLFEMGINRFAILYPDNSYGHFFMNLFWDRLEEMGGVVTAVESYDPESTDFADQIKKMTGRFFPRPASLVRELTEMRTPEEEESSLYPDEPEPIVDFDAIFIPDNYQKVAMIAPQLVYHDVVDPLLIGTSLWQSPELIEAAGDYIQGAIFPSGFFDGSEEPCIGAFVEDYRANFDSMPGILAATGCDTMRVLKHIMQLEGVRTRTDLRKALLECRDFPGLTGNIVFDAEGEVEKEPLLLTVSGRRIVVYR